MKRAAIALLAVLCILPLWAKKTKTNPLPRILRNYPSGAIDEYHFRPGYVTVRGSLKSMPAGTARTLSLTGMNIFTEKDFVETVAADSTGRFCTTVLVPHTQFFRLDDEEVFAAMGDTLDVTVTTDASGNTSMIFGGTGVTGEVNRVWPLLRRQFGLDAPSEKPWEARDRQVMLDWKKRKMEKFGAIVRAVDADTIGLMNGCSDFAKDVLKSCMLACIPEDIGTSFHQYWFRVVDEKRGVPPEKRIAQKEIWDFLPECEAYLLNNPCMLFTAHASWLVNNLEFGPLAAYLYLDNGIDRTISSADDDAMADYKANFILPAAYDREMHRRMRDFRKGRLLSVADYYQMATDTMCADFGLQRNFMMQVCMAHEVLRDVRQAMGEEDETEDWLPHTAAERLAGAIPQITSPLVAHHVVQAYRCFVAEKEGHRPEPSPSPEGDAIFNALVERYKGNVLVIDFWGIGCAPCRAGMLGQRADVEYFKDKPVRFLYLCNEKDTPREVDEKFMNDNHIRGEHIYLTADEWNHLVKKFQFLGIPYHVTVNKKGRIVGKNNNPERHYIEDLIRN